MSNSSTPVATKKAPTFQACIDLPGEPVRCWAESDVTVLLRKHRDVIFHFALDNGVSYTLESDKDWFYVVRDKKRVKRASFNDGERFHIWVGRGFKGQLKLTGSDGSVTRYFPNQLDPNNYPDTPGIKPAPIIFSAFSEAALKKEVMRVAKQASMTPTLDRFSRGQSEEQLMLIAEVKPGAEHSLPKEIIAYFQRGGEETALSPDGIITRNWIQTQLAGAGMYLADNRDWIKELWKQQFRLQRVVHKAGPKYYIIFSGSPGMRQALSAARYGAANPKVLRITSGAGSFQGTTTAMWNNAKGSVRGGGLAAIVFGVSMDVAEWLRDYEQRDPVTGKPKRDFYDLFGKVGLTVAKTLAGVAIGSAIVSGVVMALLALGVITAASVVAVVVGTVVVGAVVAFGLDVLDQRTGTSKRLADSLRSTSEYLNRLGSSDYDKYRDALGSAYPQEDTQ